MSMIEEFVKTIVGKNIRSIALFVKESRVFIISTLILVLVAIVYIREILSFLGSVLLNLGLLIIDYFFGFNVDERYFLVFLIFYIFSQIILFRKLFRNNFEENFDNYLQNWSIPKNAEWAITDDMEVSGRVLQVTSSGIPGILKEGRNWYDYEIDFYTKIIEDNFTILVRAKEKGNAVMLQFKTNKLRPHLIVDGIFVVDDKNEQSLQIKIPIKKWIHVLVKVYGDYVDVFLDGSRVTYRIPSGLIRVPIDRVHSTMSITELERLESEYLHMQAMKERAEKETGVKSDPSFWKPYNFIFDFDIGTIGFRESGNENALFRKIKIKRK
jgi:hypothetical protein